MSEKINIGKNRVFTCDQLASALTIAIGDKILKPKVVHSVFLIIVEYKYRRKNKTVRFKQALSEHAMQLFNGTVEAYIYEVRTQIKLLMLKEGVK